MVVATAAAQDKPAPPRAANAPSNPTFEQLDRNSDGYVDAAEAGGCPG